MDQDRRDFLKGLALLAVLPLVARAVWATDTLGKVGGKLIMSNADWKKKLTPQQYDVLREEGTERPFSSPLNDEHRKGEFVCAACDQELFDSKAKFDSGTGWPSFYQPIAKGAVETTTDYKLLAPRTEVHCARCGGHLGHVFNDGPQPTGLRYCMNGVAMKFKPE